MACYWQWIKRKLLTQKSNQIFNKFIRSSLCDYSDSYILVTGNITVTRTIAGDPVQRKQPLDAATQVIFKTVHLLKIVE